MRAVGVTFVAGVDRSWMAGAIADAARAHPATARVAATEPAAGDASATTAITERRRPFWRAVTVVRVTGETAERTRVAVATTWTGWEQTPLATLVGAGTDVPMIAASLIASVQRSGADVGPVEALPASEVAQITGATRTWRVAAGTAVGMCVVIAIAAIGAVLQTSRMLVSRSTGAFASSMRQLGLRPGIDVALALGFFVPLVVLAVAAAAVAFVAKRSAVAPRVVGSAAERAASGTAAVLTAGAGIGLVLSSPAVVKSLLWSAAGIPAAWTAGCAAVALGAFMTWAGLTAVKLPAWRPPAGAATLGVLGAIVLAGVPVAIGAGPSQSIGSSWARDGFVVYGRAPLGVGTIPLKPTAVECVSTSWCLVTGFERGDTGTMTSSDGGKTWSVEGTSVVADPFAIRCIDDRTCLGVGSSPVRTMDGGRSWQAVSLLPGSWLSSAVGCGSGGVCVVGGQQRGPGPGASASGAIFRTTDGGSTIEDTRVPGGPWWVHAISCSGARRCIAVGSEANSSSSPGLILVSDDAGTSWASVPAPDGTPALGDVSCGDASHCIAVGVTASPGGMRSSSVAVTTSNGGATWTQVALPVPHASAIRVACTSAEECIALGQGARSLSAFDTTDGGRMWQASPLHAPDQTSFGPLGTAPFNLSCTATGTCVVVGVRWTPVGTRAYVAYTPDGGRAWAEGRLARSPRS